MLVGDIDLPKPGQATCLLFVARPSVSAIWARLMLSCVGIKGTKGTMKCCQMRYARDELVLFRYRSDDLLYLRCSTLPFLSFASDYLNASTNRSISLYQHSRYSNRGRLFSQYGRSRR